jgi:hypothetical protein
VEEDHWEDLESVLDSFEERRELDLDSRREAEEKEARFRRSCTAILTDLVVPTYEEAAGSLTKRAHECAVTKRLADYDIPSADLTVRPYVPEERWVRRSRLSMRCVCTEGFVVFWEVMPPRQEPISGSTTRPLEAVDGDYVRDQVIRFVRAVLKDY